MLIYFLYCTEDRTSILSKLLLDLSLKYLLLVTSNLHLLVKQRIKIKIKIQCGLLINHVNSLLVLQNFTIARKAATFFS